jgi:hypothetical protein
MEKILNDLDTLYDTMIHEKNFDLAIKIKQLQVKIFLSLPKSNVMNLDFDKISTHQLEEMLKMYEYSGIH